MSRKPPAGKRDAQVCSGSEPPRDGHDPHDDTPKIPAAQALKDMFWHPRGFVNDVCNVGPCTGPQF
jgi:hypothetical protein